MTLDRMDSLRRIKDTGIVAVVRTETADKAIKIADAVKEGGIEAIEITMTVPGAIDVIKKLNQTYSKDEVLIGAGSVLDAETARACMLAGAEYIVSPIFDQEMVDICNKYDKAVVAGAMTPTEAKNVMEAGADIVKVFPATLFGPKIIKAIKGPMPQAKLLPTGGVDTDNVKDWIKAGSYAVAAGSAICAGADTGDYEQVTKTAAEFIKKIKEARKNI